MSVYLSGHGLSYNEQDEADRCPRHVGLDTRDIRFNYKSTVEERSKPSSLTFNAYMKNPHAARSRTSSQVDSIPYIQGRSSIVVSGPRHVSNTAGGGDRVAGNHDANWYTCAIAAASI